MGSINDFRISIAKKYNDEVVFSSGVKLYMETKTDHQEKVATKGVVTFVPETVFYDNDTKWKDGEDCGLKVGDIVYIRYDVVADSNLSESTREHANAITFLEDGEVKTEWFCNLEQIFAVERDGMQMMGDYVLVKSKETVTEKIGLIIMPEMLQKTENKNMAVVVNAGNKKGLREGDTVVTQLRYAGKYNLSGIFGDDVHVVDSKRIEAKIA